MSGTIEFVPATREQSRGRLLIFSPSGAGKTYTGMLVTQELADGKPWAVIDTEHGSAAKYADEFTFSHYVMGPPYDPRHYINAIAKAEQGEFGALLIDSITHEWDGTGGVKEIVDAAKGQFGGNSQAAWSVGTPLHNKFVEAILAADCHIVCTARAKTDWMPGEDNRGRSIFIKVGLAPMQRDTIEYEFDLSLLMDMENNGTVSKSRVRPFPLNTVIEKPGGDFGRMYLKWLREGSPPRERPAAGNVDVTGATAEALRDEATTMLDALQKDYGDFSEGVTWAERMQERCVEWFGHGLPDMSPEELNTLLSRLRATRRQKDEERAAAATAS